MLKINPAGLCIAKEVGFCNSLLIESFLSKKLKILLDCWTFWCNIEIFYGETSQESSNFEHFSNIGKVSPPQPTAQVGFSHLLSLVLPAWTRSIIIFIAMENFTIKWVMCKETTWEWSQVFSPLLVIFQPCCVVYTKRKGISSIFRWPKPPSEFIFLEDSSADSCD